MKKTDFQKIDQKKYKEGRKFFEMRKGDLKKLISEGKDPDARLAQAELDRRGKKKKSKSKK